jgi:hypothetical protein
MAGTATLLMGDGMPNFNVRVGDRRSRQYRDSMAFAMSLLTAATTGTEATGSLIAALIKSEAEAAANQGDAVERLAHLSFAFAAVAQATAIAGYSQGRRQALAEGEAAPDLPDMARLMPLISDFLRTMNG